MNSTANSLPRVLHVFASVDRGGAEIRTLELLEYLGEVAGTHEIVTLSGRTGELAERFESAGVRVIPCAIKSIFFFKNFLTVLHDFNPDVVHSHIAEFSAIPLFLARIFGVRQRIAHFRSDGPQSASLLVSLRTRILRYFISINATRILGVAPSTLENAYGSDWQSDNRARVIANGLNLNRFNQVQKPRSFPMIPDGELRLLHVGRGAPVKNRKRAIEVLAEVNKTTPAQLIFVGRDTPDDRQLWIDFSEALGVAEKVHFMGERDDVISIMKSSHMILQTSFYEGLPGVLLEALAAGLPCVASNLPGARFMYEQVGGLTLLELSENNTEWARAIIEVSRKAETNTLEPDRNRLSGTIFDLVISAESMNSVWKEKL